MKKGFISGFRKNLLFKPLAGILAFIFLSGLFISPVFALTSGPSAPEANGFTPVEQQQLVDPFTGDFSYNIPLPSVGDYPLNLSYSSSGVSMDAEASWVGLGWNLNIGAINRTVRGLPDDFNGDEVTRKFNIKDNITVGGSLGSDVIGDLELAGFEIGKYLKLKAGSGYSVEIKFNNYTGFSLGQTISAGISAGLGAKNSSTSFLGAGANIALSSGEEGLDIKPSVSFSMQMNRSILGVNGFSANYGLLFNSRNGLKQRTIGMSPKFQSTVLRVPYAGNVLNLTEGSRTTMFNPITYTPKFEFPFYSSAFTFSFKLGPKVFAGDISGTAEGFFSKQALTTKSINRPSFGYLYLQSGQSNSGALLDFNREKDATYMHGAPHLPLAYLTYDIFSVGAQGLGGTYRAHRNEAGYVFDPTVYNTSESYSLGGEINLANLVKGGVDGSVVRTTSHTSCWYGNNYPLPHLPFQSYPVNSSIKNVIFKKTGQISKTVSQNFKDKIGANRAVAFNFIGSGTDLELPLSNTFVTSDAQNTTINSSIEKLTEPVQQNETMQILTVSDVQKAGLYQYPLISNSSKGHHIGQIIVYDNEGKRYIFGLPAYNTYQKEVSFNVTAPVNKSDALVSYSAEDNSVNNKKGLDHYFDATTTPPFAYAYYLTDVLSSDYVDITGDGPSQDDYGNYTKVSYDKAHSDFKWRTPVEENMAQYDPGLYSKDDDDKGHYVYGTKDIWYPATIETKTEIAVFHTSPRDDSYEASGENGGTGSNSMLKLDSISLYNYADKQLSGNGAIPLLCVHFVYDYLLCTGIPNGSSGKLTLKGIYFTHGNSYKDRQSGYEFQYSSSNPSYNMQASDRWGTYKPDDSLLPNRIFPYTKQDTLTNDYAKAWLLENIDLPSGGYIHVNYESDQYNYVQDKQAMTMFNVVAAVQNVPNGNWTNSDNKLCNVAQNFPYLIFQLGKSFANNSDAYDYVRNSIGDLNDENGIAKNLYFNFMVNMDGFVPPTTNPKYFDRVYGFCELDENSPFGIIQNQTGYLGWIKVKLVKTDRGASLLCHPISKAAFQFCKLNTPKYAFDQTDLQDIEVNPLEATINILKNASLIKQLVDFAQGPNQTLRTKGIGQQFIPEQSYIRLHCYNKLGGGARVKTLTYHNAWNIMQPGEDSLSFTDEYHYTLKGFGDTMSSGVAVYEPLLGGDEIPLHLPVTYSPKTDKPRWSKTLVPDDQYMAIKPYGEMAFPAPAVGYSRVVIKRKVPDNSSAAGTGYSVFHFHTAKDFPVKTENTSINPQRRKKKPFFSFIKSEMHDYLYATQGYAVELNDMHGRIHSSEIFDAHGSLISKTESEYSLDEEIKVLKENGLIENQNLTNEIDFTVDFREQESETEFFALHANLGTFIWPWPPTPITIPYAIPAIMKEKTRFRSAVATKVINRYAILTKQTVTDLGAYVTTDNLVYDPVTGSPVLTRTNNAFNDTLYNFTYPAHLIYPGMQTVSLNMGNVCSLTTDGNGIIATGAGFLYPGDELINRGTTQRLWVYKQGSDLYLLDRNGNVSVFTTSSTFFIIRSGHRNMLSQNAGTVTTLNNPLVQLSPSSWILDLNISKKILNSDALTFRDYWHKPARHLINKDTLSCATYDPEPITRIVTDTITITGCYCTANDSTLLWTGFFNNLIANDTLITANPIKIPFGPMSYWWEGILSGNSVYGSIFEDYSGIAGPPPQFVDVNPCFQIDDPGSNHFNLLNYFADTGFIEKNFTLNIKKLNICDSQNFEIHLQKSAPGIQFYSDFPVSSCFNMFDCDSVSGDFVIREVIVEENCFPAGFKSGPSCICNLTTYGSSWLQEFGDLIIKDNEFLTNTSPSWQTALITDTSRTDSSIMAGLSCYDFNCDTCFLFQIPPGDFLDDLQQVLDMPYGNLNVEFLPPSVSCTDTVTTNEFTLKITRNFGNGEITLMIPVVSLCGDIFYCIPDPSWKPEEEGETDNKGCDCPVDSIINPYQSGLLGNWRPFEAYKFLTPRNPASTNTPPNLRNDGYYGAFFPFWNYSLSANSWQADTVKWTRANRITIYDPLGNELENKDALGNYSSALFGYNGQLPLALCSNAQFKEMGYDGFEDYYNKDIPYGIRNFAHPCFNYFHLKFEDYTDDVTALESHTGLYSLLLPCDSGVSFTAGITPPLCEIITGTGNPQCGCPAASVPYALNSCNMLPLFSPNSGKEKNYLLSFWAKEGTSQMALPQTGDSISDISIEILDSANRQIDPMQITWQFNPPSLTYASVDIEGWRQFTYQFTLPVLPPGLHLKTTISKKTSNPLFIDDFRIHPYDANMKSFVFNPFNHRLMATLDENNYAAFYQYDERGKRQVARRETERGIMSVSYNIIEQKLK